MVDMLGRLSAETAVLRARLEVTTRQVASGQRAEAQGDLGPDVPRAVTLRGEVARRETYVRAAQRAEARMEVTQSALGRLTDIAREFRADVTMRIRSADPGSLVTVATRARAALREVGELLNTRHAGEYVFGGSDVGRPPVPDPAGLMNTAMATDIAGAVAGLAPGNGLTVAADTLTIAAQDDSPFSPFLTNPAQGGAEPRRGVPTGDGEVVGYGIHAARNTEASSTGETAGSWARDLMRNLMALASLTPAQGSAAPDDFDALVGSLREGFRAAEETLAEEAGSLGLVQTRVEETRTRHAKVTDLLKTELAGIQEVDLAETLTRLQGTRAVLEASYRATASLSSLSLANFLR